VDAEVCIVGAGAAGGIMALELARRGIQVLVIEAGPRHDFAQRGEYARRYLKHDNPWKSPGDLDRHTTSGTPGYRLDGRRARGVGGSTLFWEGYALRLHPDDLRLRTRHGVGDDWPLAYADLEPYYTRAERALGVAGAPDDPWAGPRSAPFPLPAFPWSYSDGLFARACASTGIALHHLPQARNSQAYDGRAGCQACGTCHVCPTGAKASVDLTHVARAEATGHARVLADSSVVRLDADRSGGVRAALVARARRPAERLTARVFVLAGGAVENARLLLHSSAADHPHGLGNRSGLVGRLFTSHPSVDVTGRAPVQVHPYRTGFSSAMSRQFAVAGDRAARGAFMLELLNSAGGTPEAIAARSGLWGAELKKHVQEQFGRRLGIRVFCEQLPDRGNAVALDPHVRDQLGTPVPHLRYSVGPYERRALDEARDVAGRILAAAGCDDIRTSGLGVAAHQIGTHRMGADPATSVVDADLRAHDVANLYLVGAGAFVTASASPPTLTIAALAIRAAERIARELRPGAPA